VFLQYTGTGPFPTNQGGTCSLERPNSAIVCLCRAERKGCFRKKRQEKGAAG
jgi:hypothetical protein